MKVNRYEIVLTAVVFWASRYLELQNWTFQQDWAPAHGAKTTVELCRQQFPDFSCKDIWPSNSPDLNPMDFSNILQQFRVFYNQIGEDNGDTDMSLITGRLRVGRVRDEKDKKDDGQLAIYTAGDYFKERSWRGLEDSVRLGESIEVEEGRSGIAAGYGNERKT
uniref:DDE_3 domain-containing protein n=1 Tax=Heterorhabditis bacteriophora TaxID=37862 RepID=A0A1I7XPL8_HETBA